MTGDEGSGSGLGLSYRLVGVVSHLADADSLCSGHYVADSRDSRRPDASWRTFDDLHTHATTFLDIARDRAHNSYVFLYRRHQMKL